MLWRTRQRWSERLAAEFSDWSAVIDGEIVSLDRRGKSQFRDLLVRRGSEREHRPVCIVDGDIGIANSPVTGILPCSQDSKQIPIQSQEDMPCVYR